MLQLQVGSHWRGVADPERLGVITPHTNMKTQTNTSRRERLAKWQAAHKQLLQDDAQYRKRHTTSHFIIYCLLAITLPFYLPLFGVRLFVFGPVADVCIIVCVAAIIACWVLRQLWFQTQRIQSYLQLSHGA